MSRRILYCHCAFERIIEPAVKERVLAALTEADVAFDAVPDLCALSARKDPTLRELAGEGELLVAACFPRAVRWLFHAAGAPLDEARTEVINLRELPADEAVVRLLREAR